MMENLRCLSNSAKQYLKVPHHGDSSVKIAYNVSITTGAMKFAGTDANVYFSITGIGGDQTSRVKLDNTFRDDFERGETDKFRVKLEDIGIPTLVHLEVDHTGLFADWFASNVTVQKSGDKTIYEFPVYAWVDGLCVASTGEAYLPQNEESIVTMDFRKNELSNRRHLYRWRNKEDPRAKGLPGFIAATCHSALPRNIQFTDGLHKDFEESKGVVFMHALQDKVHGLSGDAKEYWESFDEILKFLSNPRFPKMSAFQKYWKDDAEFGRQMISGCSPNLLKRCRKIPDNFPVTESMVQNFLDSGRSLKGEIEAGKIFIADCSIASGIKQHKQCVPICLLYQNSKGILKPIAIQLQQSTGDKIPIFTPEDEEYDWLLAKMHFRCAESNIQQVVERMLYTHFVLEPFAVAMMRCLSARHPVFKLLYPHLQYVCAAATMARTSLFAPNGVFDRILSYAKGGSLELLKKAFMSFNMPMLDVRARMKDQGTESLVNYHYRDDATALYECITKYVDAMISLFYKEDVAVLKDKELQQFIKEVHNEGFSWEDGNSKGCPKNFATVKDLGDLVSMLIFTSSCQHSAVNSGQFEVFMHTPNAPFSLGKSPPTKKGTANLQTVIGSLPDKRKSVTQLDLVHTFAKKYEDQVILGKFSQRLFISDDAQDVMKKFQDDLTSISQKIKERNSRLDVAYEYLLPENIPAGVTV